MKSNRWALNSALISSMSGICLLIVDWKFALGYLAATWVSYADHVIGNDSSIKKSV
jgi:hypothetical protein